MGIKRVIECRADRQDRQCDESQKINPGPDSKPSPGHGLSVYDYLSRCHGHKITGMTTDLKS